MITHIIYEIVGRKVGCCKDLEERMLKYVEAEGKRPRVRIRERLHDKTDQEAGDIEWQWADKLKYRRGVHYTVSMNNFAIGGRKGGARRAEVLTPEQLTEIGHKAAAGVLKAGGGWRNLTPDEIYIIHRKGGLSISYEQRVKNGSKGGKETARLKKSGCYMPATCPHCGKVGKLAPLKRWHFDNCPHKPKMSTPRLVRRAA